MSRVHWNEDEKLAIALNFTPKRGQFHLAMEEAQTRAGIKKDRRRQITRMNEVPWLKDLLEELSGEKERREREAEEQRRIEAALEAERQAQLESEAREREREALRQEIIEGLSLDDMMRGFKHHIRLLVADEVEMQLKLRNLAAIDRPSPVAHHPHPKHDPLPVAAPKKEEQKRFLIVGPKAKQAADIRTAFPHVQHCRILHGTEFNSRHIEGSYDTIIILTKFVGLQVQRVVRDHWPKAHIEYFPGSADELKHKLITIFPPKPSHR
jgi:hypothetical protein